MAKFSMDVHREDKNRRLLLIRLLQAAGLSLAALPVPLRRAFPGTAKIGTKPSPEGLRKQYMEHAFEMKKRAVTSGDQPYGAVVVKDGRIVGEGPSRVVINEDPTAHAEMEAIRDAARRLGTRDLSGCVIYATSRPCQMCETAAYWANLSGIYFGASSTAAGAPRYSSC